MALIHDRTDELRRGRRRRGQRAVDALCVMACLLVIVVVGVSLPGMVEDGVGGFSLGPAGTASLLASPEALGYVVMGLLSFLLGVCVTLLIVRIRTRRERDRRGDGVSDEL